MLITFSGIHGSGKSTQVSMTADWLAARGWQVEVARPAFHGWHVMKALAKLDTGDDQRLYGETHPNLWSVVYGVDWAYFGRFVVEPALAAGKVVLTDRYIYDALMFARMFGADNHHLGLLDKMVALVPKADVPLLLDLDAEVSARRLRARGRALRSSETPSALRASRATFLELDEDRVIPFHKLGADRPASAIQASIRAILAARMNLEYPVEAQP
jgi:dTMP kinase